MERFDEIMWLILSILVCLTVGGGIGFLLIDAILNPPAY